jgi:hypothetical protein
MNQSHSEPKSAESRESGIVDTASFNTPYAHSDNSAQVGQIAMSVSMHNSFSGELGSENAYHAREDYEIINQLAPHVYEYDDDSSVSSSYTEVSAELTYDEEMAMYRAIEHRNLLRDIRNFFRAEWIDPVRIYSESCMLNDIGLPYEIATRVLEYYTYSPELGFYVTFDMKLREVVIRLEHEILCLLCQHLIIIDM